MKAGFIPWLYYTEFGAPKKKHIYECLFLWPWFGKCNRLTIDTTLQLALQGKANPQLINGTTTLHARRGVYPTRTPRRSSHCQRTKQNQVSEIQLVQVHESSKRQSRIQLQVCYSDFKQYENRQVTGCNYCSHKPNSMDGSIQVKRQSGINSAIKNKIEKVNDFNWQKYLRRENPPTLH